MLNVQSTAPLSLIQAGGIPAKIVYTAEAHREVTHSGHVDEYVGTVQVSLAGVEGEAFPCHFHFQRSLADFFLPERLVDEAVRGHLATNPVFRDWLRRRTQA